MRRLVLITAIVAGAVGAQASTAGAQSGRGANRTEPVVPPAYQPPPGMCRIWLEGVPPAQQPAPTDCATAVRNRPANGRVLFGDDANRSRKPARGATRGDDGAERGGPDRGASEDRSGRSARSGGDACAGLNRDPACDEVDSSGDRVLPSMSVAMQYARGERPAEATRWIGAQSLTARVSEMGRNGVPTRVVWLNDVGDVVQVWLDRDRDGRADRVEIYRDGRRVQSFGQS
jgi:hypothetical protein